ncbi:MAG TPA: helix-turn-helix domain-containing protein [Streptosporangiaceae bacterium]|jgi:predicted ArsR family transcriptional regulator
MDDAELDAVGVLADPVRRALYRYVAGSGREVGRGEAADGAGVKRSLAAFHLDRLAEAGLLDVGYRRPAGRGGPGAGRPAKMYRRAAAEHAVTLPPRSYDLAAEVLADVVEGARLDAEVAESARARGRAGARPGAELRGELAARGYEPYDDGADIRLRNCPFHRLAADQPVVACAMNLALLEGLLDGIGGTGRTARMDARPGDCCVALAASKTKSH